MTRKSKEKSQPPFGVLLDRLNIPAAALAKHLHVDASLVSKWKNGQRNLSSNTDHFESILDFFMISDGELYYKDLRLRLTELLKEFSPLESLETTCEVREHLRAFLSEQLGFSLPQAAIGTSKAVSSSRVLIYEGSEGRRSAISEVLDLAESMTAPGEIIFTECEDYRWLLEDQNYAKQWNIRLQKLLERGFKATFIFHFTTFREKFSLFFRLYNQLLFHRNLDWYYHEYYDDEVYWFTFFILEHARSVMCLSIGQDQCDTTVFTDCRSISRHKKVTEVVKRNSRPMFIDFPKGRVLHSIRELLIPGWYGGTIFAFLPAPLLAATNTELLTEIMQANNISSATIRRCIKERLLFEGMLKQQTHQGSSTANQLITIYQIEPMRRHIDEDNFISVSLSLMTGKPVRVTKEQYARSILHIANSMEDNPNHKIVLASDKDHIYLPGLNCWCKDKEWLIHMDSHGIRFSRENVMVRATHFSLMQCLHKIPPIRSQFASVKQILLEVAEELRR